MRFPPYLYPMRLVHLYIYIIVWLSLPACQGMDAPTGADELQPTRDSSSLQLTEVTTTRIAQAIFTYRVEATGKLQSLSDYTVVAETGGMLTFFPIKTGSTVQAGQVVARFATESIELKLERARLQAFNAQKEFESQLLGYERLLESKSEAEKADIKEKLRISTGLALALQDIKEAEYELAQAELKAPFGGIAANVSARQGERVAPGTALFRLYQPGQLVMAARVLETDLGLMQSNLTATVYPLGADKPVPARLHSINPLVDENGMVTVYLLLQKSGQSLFTGMNARAEIAAPATRTLAVPRDALVYRGGRAVVFTYQDGLAKWNYVTTRRDNGQQVEITEGLQEGAEVITSNNIQLAHDAPVQKVSATPQGGVQ